MGHLQKIALATLIALLPCVAAAQELGNAQVGHEYAKKICAGCHEVEPGEPVSIYPDVPSFQTVADTPGMTERALAVWLQTSHPNMPNIIVAPDDMDNVIAYITSLRTQR